MQNGLWWTKKGREVAQEVNSLAEQHRKKRYRKLVACRLLYLDLPYEHYGDKEIGFYRPSSKSNYNLVQGAVDATHAKIVTARPRPQVVTIAGRWKMQRRAKLRQRWIDGEYERLRAFEKLSDMARDALIYGTGCLKVYEKDGKVAVDRVWVGDLFVDPREERFDCVRSLYQVAAIDKSILKARFPGRLHKLIDKAPAPMDDALFPDMHVNDAVAADLATVIEAWRLPAGPEAPGRRVVVCGDAVLVDEEWTEPCFPFVFYRWARDPARFFGQGMVERGAGIQGDLSDHTATIQDSYEAFVPKLAIENGSQVSVETIDDEVGKALYYTGVLPQVMNSSPISPDFLRREDMIAERFYRVLGVSEMSAGSVKPAGVDSGKGMLVYQDVETQRFMPQGRDYEQASVDLADRIFSVADRIAKTGDAKALRVFGGKRGLEIAEYQAPEDEDEVYITRTFPVSGLSKTLTGKIEEIDELKNIGAVTDPKHIQKLLELPDLEEFNDLEMAMRDAVDKEIDRCLDGDQGTPSTYMDLAYAIQRGDQEVNRAFVEGAPEEILQLLRNFCGAARMMANPPAPDDLSIVGGPAEPPMTPLTMDPMMMDPNMGPMMDPMAMGAGPMPDPMMMGPGPEGMPPDAGGMPPI